MDGESYTIARECLYLFLPVGIEDMSPKDLLVFLTEERGFSYEDVKELESKSRGH